jgi:hypothetical protein
MDIDMVQSQINNLKADTEKLRRQVEELQCKLNKFCGHKLSWEEAPAWARWAAMDKDQCWWWYEAEPFARTTTWSSERLDLACTSFYSPPCDDWRESKQARPLAQA